ncbi:MAG: hypothetical protein ACFB21_09385 [Opitutales bacterium]
MHASAPTFAEIGVHLATVTIAGQVAEGGPFDPGEIAEAYWDLHQQPRDQRSTERIFNGKSYHLTEWIGRLNAAWRLRMLLAQSGVRDDEAGPTGPVVALAALLCVKNHLDQFTDLSGKMV